MSFNIAETENKKDAPANTYNKGKSFFIKRKTFYETSQRTNIGNFCNNSPISQIENVGVVKKKHPYFEDYKNRNFNKIKKIADKSFIQVFHKPTKRNYFELFSQNKKKRKCSRKKNKF